MREDSRDFLSQPQRIVDAIITGLSQWEWYDLWSVKAGEVDYANPRCMHFSASPSDHVPEEWINRLLAQGDQVQTLIELSLHNIAKLSGTVEISRAEKPRTINIAVTRSHPSDPRSQSDVWADPLMP